MSNSFPTSHVAAAEANAGVSKVAQPLVIVVDDHADTREMLRFAIEARGCRVVEAADGDEAVRLAQRILPDIILMDTGMPRVDGYLATERIRKIDVARKVAIIFLSGYEQSQARTRAFAAGGDDYFVKPVNLEQLELALERYLLIARAHAC
jgi:CheY-like chemotaxis protein